MAISHFKELALAKTSSPTAANDLLSAQEAWMACYENNDCGALVQQGVIAQAADAHQRSGYYANHPDKVMPYVTDYIDQNPDLLNHYSEHFPQPSFVMKLSQHVDDNARTYTGLTTLLCCFTFLKCLRLNPLRLFNCRKNSATNDDLAQQPRKHQKV